MKSSSCRRYRFTHVKPTKNLVTINIQFSVDILDNAEPKKVNNNVHRSVRARPHVSVMKPQKCEDNNPPIYIAERIRPCSLSDVFRSHLDIGNAIDMLKASIDTQSIASAATARMMC